MKKKIILWRGLILANGVSNNSFYFVISMRPLYPHAYIELKKIKVQYVLTLSLFVGPLIKKEIKTKNYQKNFERVLLFSLSLSVCLSICVCVCVRSTGHSF